MAAGLADIMNAEQYAALKREAYRTQGITDDNSIFTANELQGLKIMNILIFRICASIQALYRTMKLA